MLADYFGIFDTDAKKVVLYYDNKPKFDRLLDKALETYARKRERAKKRSAAARELKQYNWEVPEERVYDSETNHIETAKIMLCYHSYNLTKYLIRRRNL